MSVFPKTRAAAGHIAGTGPGELARARATILLARLGACEDILPGGEGGVPAALHGLLRDLVLAVRDLAGPAWLDASGDDPDVTAFTALEATASAGYDGRVRLWDPADPGAELGRAGLRLIRVPHQHPAVTAAAADHPPVRQHRHRYHAAVVAAEFARAGLRLIQAADRVRAAILSGQLTSGDTLPSVPDLARLQGLKPGTPLPLKNGRSVAGRTGRPGPHSLGAHAGSHRGEPASLLLHSVAQSRQERWEGRQPSYFTCSRW